MGSGCGKKLPDIDIGKGKPEVITKTRRGIEELTIRRHPSSPWMLGLRKSPAVFPQTAKLNYTRGSGAHTCADTVEMERKSSTTGTIFNIMKYSTHDGPGIRTAVFFKGCPLSCPWCHNPEGQSARPELSFSSDRCVRCGECVKVCPENAISVVDGVLLTRRDVCRPCGCCSKVCQSRAREIVGKIMTAPQVMEEIEKDIIFYDESKGGVTFSGGEPLMQPDFLTEMLQSCKEKDIHTAVETCGLVKSEDLARIEPYVDLFLYDLKIIDGAKHRQLAGASNRTILMNLRELSQSHDEIIIRFPLIPGINDEGEDVLQIRTFISSLRNVQEIHILPYHKGGIEKYRRLGKEYRLPGIQPPSDQKLSQIEDIFRRVGLRVKIGG